MTTKLPLAVLMGWGITAKGVLVGVFVNTQTDRPFGDTSTVQTIEDMDGFSIVTTEQYRYICIGRMNYDQRKVAA